MKLEKQKTVFGFILIELLIVVAVIAVISALIWVPLSNHQKKARDAKRKADLNDIQIALQLYYQDFGRYPGNQNTTYSSLTPNSPWIPDLDSTYIKELPRDPINTLLSINNIRAYLYIVNDPTQTYCLATNLEYDQDPQKKNECGITVGGMDYTITNP